MKTGRNCVVVPFKSVAHPVPLLAVAPERRRAGGCRMGRVEPESFLASLLVWGLARCWTTTQAGNET